MRRIHCLLVKEWAQLCRDPRLFGMLLVAPLIQLLILGSASNTDVRDIALAVRDNDHTYQSRELARALGASAYFQVTRLGGSETDDAPLLVTGRAGLILVIPPGFGAQLARRQPAAVQVLVDGADSNFAVQGMNYLQKACRQFSAGLVQAALGAPPFGRVGGAASLPQETGQLGSPARQSVTVNGAGAGQVVLPLPWGEGRGEGEGPIQAAPSSPLSGGDTTLGYPAARLEGDVRSPQTRASLPTVAAECRVWYNPDLKSRFYMVPGVMALVLLVTTMVVTSMALVKEREEGTMEQLIVTPLRPGELIVGKLLPFVGVGFAEVTFALLIIRLVFHVPFRGSVLLLYVLSGVFLLTTLGLGLFISSLAKTQHQAMMIATFFVMMPFVLLSGFAFPVANMPPTIQTVAQLIPLKYYLVILRSIFLKGAGWAELWPDAVALLVWGMAILGLAIIRFRKRLD